MYLHIVLHMVLGVGVGERGVHVKAAEGLSGVGSQVVGVATNDRIHFIPPPGKQ